MSDSPAVSAAPVAAPAPSAEPSAAQAPASPAPEAAAAERQGARFAEAARRTRELTQRQQELKVREEKVSAFERAIESKASNPLAVLEAAGLSYEDITAHILDADREPTAEERVAALEQRLSAKEQAEQDAHHAEAERSAQATIDGFKQAIESKAKEQADTYELVNIHGAYDTVFDVVQAYWDSNGEVLPVETALQHVEAALTVYDPVHMPYDHGTATGLRAQILAALPAAG